MANVITVTNLAQGPGDLYQGLFGATEPADAAVNSAPAASAWNGLGGTNGGIKLTINQTYDELEVDQIVDIVGRRKTKREFEISTDLAEVTLNNLVLALNESAPTTASGYSSWEPTIDNSATQPGYFAMLFDAYAPSGFRRRFIGRRMLSTNNLATTVSKTDQTLFSVTFSAHYVSSSIKPFKVVDQTS